GEDSAEWRMVVRPRPGEGFGGIGQEGRLGAGQGGIAGVVVLWVVMVDTAHDGEPMSLLCDQWHVLADAIAGHAGRDWLELAADLDGCFGLHVEGVVMRWAALLKQDDTGPGPTREPRNRTTRRCRRGGAHLKESGQGQPTGAQR